MLSVRVPIWDDAAVGFFHRIAQQREQVIFGHARPFLDDREAILAWARTRRAVGRGSGFVFLTRKRLVIAWTRSGDDKALDWSAIESWGLDTQERGGPVLGVTTESDTQMVQIVTETDGMAANARAFVSKMHELHPSTEAPFDVEGRPGKFHPAGDVRVTKQIKSPWQVTRRFLVTAIGIAIVVLGIILLALPGPGLLVVIAGLAILGSEYDWAKDAMVWTRQKVEAARDKIARRKQDRKGT